MNELKPCPFCGGKAIVFHIPENTPDEISKHSRWLWNNPGMWVIGCDTSMCICNFNNVSVLFLDESQAIEAWNRRVNND